MNLIIDTLNTVVWGYVLVYGLVAIGIYFTFKLGFLQVRYFGEMLRCSLMRGAKDANGISPFQALCTSLASRVGTGNIAGVAVALVLGGPGAIFWMWVVAFLGMATSYAECALAQLYKVKDPNSSSAPYRGGPAYYISKGLGLPWLATVFSVCLIFSLGLFVNALQSNSIADAMQEAFHLPKLGTGIALAALTSLVIFGGIRKIATLAEYIVPFMAGAYLLVTLSVVGMNITAVPDILWTILTSAFGMNEAVGGVVGGVTVAMLNGVKRGLFSNEAGMGSAPNIAAASSPTPHHPTSQGLVQAFSVFIDTIIICTCTALIILLSGVYVPGGEITGTQLTQIALAEHMGSFGPVFIALAIFFFAFTTIIGCYAYAEMAMSYLGLAHKHPLNILRVLVLFMVAWGSVQTVKTVFDLADAALGIMATINILAVTALAPKVSALTRDYFAQKRQGKSPRFKAENHPQLAKGADHEIWK